MKYIITKNLKHYKSEAGNHCDIISDNKIALEDVIETGIIIDNRVMILDCYNVNHQIKAEKIRNKMLIQDLQLLRARAVETQYKYNSFMREGD